MRYARARGWLHQTSSEDGHVHYLKYGGVAEDAREARYQRTHACAYMSGRAQSANSISSRGDYSRAASISFRACSGAATIRERRLFERGVYSVIYGTWKFTGTDTTLLEYNYTLPQVNDSVNES